MSVIADFSVPADAFPLGDVLEVRPGVQVRLETMVPTGEVLVPYFWVEAPDIEAVEAALEASPIVETVRVLDRVGDEALFRVSWTGDLNGLMDAFRGTDCMLLSGTGHGDAWTFQLRFPEYSGISAFYQSVVDKQIPIELQSLHEPVGEAPSLATSVTADQHEALQLALEMGYFAVPREVTLVELAEALGISDSATSQRIRRGLNTLLTDALV